MAGNPGVVGTDVQFRHFVDRVEEYAIFMLTPAGAVATWNAGVGRILGYAEAEFVGRPAALIFTPEDVARGQAEFELRTAREAGHAEDERWHVRKDGSRFWATGIMSPLRDDAGGLVGYVKILRDRTDQKELHELLRGRADALAATDGRKNAFIATLAHELRNPLGGILNAAEILRLLCPNDPAVLRHAGVIDRQARQIRRLVDDLMDAARAGAGKVDLDRRRVLLGAVVRAAADAARPGCEARRQALAVVVPDAPIGLDADPDRLHQVFVNLLTNASKYTPEGGHVWFTAAAEGATAVVRVRDDGLGIPADMQARVFDLFAQAAEVRPHAQGGLGIGLTLVKSLVELHGGTVQVRSEGAGKGSEFIVRLPAVPGG